MNNYDILYSLPNNNLYYDYYNMNIENIPRNIDTNYITNVNLTNNELPINTNSNIIENINYSNNNIINDERNSNILNVKEGFIRGNMFNNLYDKYKNFNPTNPILSTNKGNELKEIQMYNFALTDLDLYLDIYPSDTNVINMYNNLVMELRKKENDYETKYGPLMLNNVFNTWNWINNPWPWEGIN